MKLDLSEIKKDKLGIIICGFSGIGKTTLGQKYENIAEIGQSLYRNIYEGIDASKISRELRKNIRVGIKKNPKWPMNYINKINELRETHDLMLVFTDFELMDKFRELNIPFIIAIPDINRKEEFINNFKKRGQDEKFCQKAASKWDEKIKELKQMKETRIILKNHEYLEDYLKDKQNLQNLKNSIEN